LFNLNFNHSFNQTPIFSNQPQLKVLFIKQLFSNHNHNSNRNTKHTYLLFADLRSKCKTWRNPHKINYVFSVIKHLFYVVFFLKTEVTTKTNTILINKIKIEFSGEKKIKKNN